MGRKWHFLDNRSSQGKQEVRSNSWHVAVDTPATIIAAIVCLVLLFCSLMLVIMQPSAVRAEVSGTNVVSEQTPISTTTTATLGATDTTTPSPTDTATPSPTDTVTPSPTDTATPSPTPKPTRTPTPRPSPTPTATATVAPTATAVPTGTAQPTATLRPTATQDPGTNATPTPVPTNQNTGGGGGTGTPPSKPTTQSGGGFPVLPVIIGLGASLAIVSVCGLGFVVLRRRVLPLNLSRTNLPPSGARPWSRLRQVSMHGNTDLYNEQTLANNAFNVNNTFNANNAPSINNAASWAIQLNGPMQGMNFAQSQGVPMNAQSSDDFIPPQGAISLQSQPYPQVQPGSGFPPSQNYPSQNYPPPQGFPPAQPNGGFYPSNIGNGDIALMLDSAPTFAINAGNRVKRKLSPVRLRWIDSDTGDNLASVTGAGISSSTNGMPTIPTVPETPQPALERDSEELPSLNDPHLRDTLKRYIQKGKLTRDGEQSNET
jgi:hypothetical protein